MTAPIVGTEEDLANSAKRSVVRAIRALATAVDDVDFGRWHSIDIDHIKANVEHLDSLIKEMKRR